MSDVSDVTSLLALLDGYHVTDRRLVRARDHARRSQDGESAAALAREMRRYFSEVERESSLHLAALDRKLDDLYQRQYNMQAERGVTERRLAGAREVMGSLNTMPTKGAL